MVAQDFVIDFEHCVFSFCSRARSVVVLSGGYVFSEGGTRFGQVEIQISVAVNLLRCGDQTRFRSSTKAAPLDWYLHHDDGSYRGVHPAIISAPKGWIARRPNPRRIQHLLPTLKTL